MCEACAKGKLLAALEHTAVGMLLTRAAELDNLLNLFPGFGPGDALMADEVIALRVLREERAKLPAK